MVHATAQDDPDRGRAEHHPEEDDREFEGGEPEKDGLGRYDVPVFNDRRLLALRELREDRRGARELCLL